MLLNLDFLTIGQQRLDEVRSAGLDDSLRW
jgi:hypothetical protein